MPTWAVKRCAPRPVGAYPAGHRHQGRSGYWAMSGSGPPRRLRLAGFVFDGLKRFSDERFAIACYAAARQAVEPGPSCGGFRSWDHPYRPQIFAGVRLAWDI